MTSTGIPADEAGVISTVLEGCLYGFSLFMYGITIWVLFYHRAIKQVNWGMVLIATLLLVLSTAHLVVDIIRMEDGFINYRDSFPDGPPAWFASVTQPTFIVKNAIYSLQTLLGDGVMVFRCYAVWQSIWVVIVPIIGMIGVAISCVVSLYRSSHAVTHSTDIYYGETSRWITLFYSATILTNFIATGLVAFRIWTISKRAIDINASKTLFKPILIIVIDSGVLYSATLLAALTCFIAQSNGQFILVNLACPIIAIAFYMIIIRLGMHRDDDAGDHSAGLTTMKSQAGASNLPRHSLYGAKSLEVHITQLTQFETTDMANCIAHSATSKGLDRGEVV